MLEFFTSVMMARKNITIPKTIPIIACEDWLCKPDGRTGGELSEGIAVGVEAGAIDYHKVRVRENRRR